MLVWKIDECYRQMKGDDWGGKGGKRDREGGGGEEKW